MATYEQEVGAQAKKAAQRAEIRKAAETRMQQILESGDIAATPTASDKIVRAFIAPIEKNTRFLIKTGNVRTVRDANSPTGERMVGRDGDVYVAFVDGIAVFDMDNVEDRLRAEWCDEHPDICRDIADPYTEAWAYMKDLQQETATSEGRLPKGIDLEKILRGDPAGNSVRHSGVERAKQRAESLKG